jgi:uncharacterized protein
VSTESSIAAAHAFLNVIASGTDPVDAATLFDEQLSFEIQGDEGALPWIGRHAGRGAIVEFLRDLRALTELVSFNVEDILASENRAAIVGSLDTRVKATDKHIRSPFAIILTVPNNLITRFQMLEDTFAVSNAAR